MNPPGPQARRDAYERQQAELASRRADVRARMTEARDAAAFAGDTEMTEFWNDYLHDLGDA